LFWLRFVEVYDHQEKRERKENKISAECNALKARIKAWIFYLFFGYLKGKNVSANFQPLVASLFICELRAKVGKQFLLFLALNYSLVNSTTAYQRKHKNSIYFWAQHKHTTPNSNNI